MAWRTEQSMEDRRSSSCRYGAAARVLSALSIALAGCAVPVDQGLVTNGTQAAYQASLQPIFAKMTLHQEAAFNWAVSDLDLAKLNEKYPGGSPKDIIRGEVGNVLATYPGRIALLRQEAAKAAPIRDDLRRIEALAPRLYFDQDFFGLQPTIRTTTINHSSRPVNQLQWKASLFLDDSATSVAQTIVTSDYRSSGGMKPGDAFSSTFKIGFVQGDEHWKTLEIRNASKTRVVLEPVLDSILDFGDRPYLATDPTKQIENLNSALQAAQSFSDI